MPLDPLTPPVRPTSEVSVVMLDSLDRMVHQLFDRLEGIDDEEYLWEPVAAAWSVRRRDDGLVTVDGIGDRDADPAPVTTTAWRLWHLSVDCLDDYARRMAGDGRDVAPDGSWFLEAEPAVAALEGSWHRWREVMAGQSDWWSQLGEAWGPWSRHSVADMVEHAGNELVHHGAEIALLRDLYQERN